MSGIRRAFLMSSLEQYLGLVINLVMVAVLARILTPSEIGTAVVGMAIAAVAFSLREFATPEFLIQRRSIDGTDQQAAFTIHVALTLVLAIAVYFAAEPLSRFYGEPGLKRFLTIALIAAVVDASVLPSITMLRRDMSFGVIARIRTISSALVAISTMLLAWLGWSYMSFAWGILVGALTTRLLVPTAAGALRQFRPSIAGWRDVFSFGCYRGATTVVEKIYETLPQMLLGHIMPMSAVGYYNRANALCGIPDRVILSPLFSIVFPALAVQVREGGDVRQAYLRLLSYISVAYWPALVFLALTADAVVHIILGANWDEVIVLVRLLALAALFWFPVIPTNPMLLAMGKNRDAFVASLVSRGVAAAILCSASFHGILAMAASQFLTLPFQMAVALHYARKHVSFSWRELVKAVSPGALVTACAIVGPSLTTMIDGSVSFSLVEFFLAAVTAFVGWLAGLYWTRHPLLDELLVPLRSWRTISQRFSGARAVSPAE